MAQTKVTSPGIADDAVTVAKIPNTSITNAKLANSSITIDGASIALGGSVTTGTYPTFTSITPSTTTNESTSFVIVGTNFGASGIPTVEFQNLTGGITTATSVVRDSATQLTVVATLAVDGTYYIRIELNTGLAVRSSTAGLTISDAPAWTTGSGTLGTIAGDFSGAVATVAATGDTVTYSEVLGTGLTGAGNANCSLNTSTGAITTTDFGGSSTSPTTYNFTIRATDAQLQTADRAFSLTSSFTYDSYYLIVAGGGAGASPGGSSPGNGRGGGGAGGFRTNYGGSAIGLTPSAVYTVTVGTGGATDDISTGGGGANGLNSSVIGTGISLASTGGGVGASMTTSASVPCGTGGSGGGAARQTSGGGATGCAGNAGGYSPVEGYAGGNSDAECGAGGGGSSAVGANNSGSTGGAGGAGTSNSITGGAITYAGGGGGGGLNLGAGGSGGGGAGAGYSTTTASVQGTDGLGGGGGGGTYNTAAGDESGKDGGDGVVILRMLTSNYTGTTTGTPTVTTDGSYKVIKFLASGSYTA
jgi:hypothetical protein